MIFHIYVIRYVKYVWLKNELRYGAPSDEIEETLKIAEAKKATSSNIKKEPADDSIEKKGKHEKRNVIRPSQVRSFVNMLRSTNYDWFNRNHPVINPHPTDH